VWGRGQCRRPRFLGSCQHKQPRATAGGSQGGPSTWAPLAARARSGTGQCASWLSGAVAPCRRPRARAAPASPAAPPPSPSATAGGTNRGPVRGTAHARAPRLRTARHGQARCLCAPAAPARPLSLLRCCSLRPPPPRRLGGSRITILLLRCLFTTQRAHSHTFSRCSDLPHFGFQAVISAQK